MRGVHLRAGDSVKKTSLIVAMLLLTTGAIAQAKPDLQTIRGIRAYCLDLEQFATKQQSAKLIFGEVCSGISCGDGNAPSHWRQFLDETSWRDAGGEDGLDNAAFVWIRADRSIQVNFTFQSGSGDWVNYANYCFRPDGSLAMVKSTLNTFYGEMTVERENLYSPEGTRLDKRIRFLDLRSKKLKKPSANFVDNKPPVFKNISNLPFYSLLKTK
jgi:hypothetical protein